MKHLKFVILFLASIFLIKCSKDEMLVEDVSTIDENKTTFSHEVFPYAKIQIIDLLRNHLDDNLETSFQKSSNSDLPSFIATIDTTEVSRISYLDYESCTFMIKPISDNYTHIDNLVMRIDNDGSYDSYIIRYSLSPEEVRSLQLNAMSINLLTRTSIVKLDFDPSILTQKSGGDEHNFAACTDSGFCIDWDGNCWQSEETISASTGLPLRGAGQFATEYSSVSCGAGGGGSSNGGNTSGGNPTGGNPTGGNPIGGNPSGGNPVGGNPVGGNPTGGDTNPQDPEEPDNFKLEDGRSIGAVTKLILPANSQRSKANVLGVKLSLSTVQKRFLTDPANEKETDAIDEYVKNNPY